LVSAILEQRYGPLKNFFWVMITHQKCSGGVRSSGGGAIKQVCQIRPLGNTIDRCLLCQRVPE
jgi:hypothetical protein